MAYFCLFWAKDAVDLIKLNDTFVVMIAAERLEKKYVLENGHDVDRK